jgi:hypothetical protein
VKQEGEPLSLALHEISTPGRPIDLLPVLVFSTISSGQCLEPAKLLGFHLEELNHSLVELWVLKILQVDLLCEDRISIFRGPRRQGMPYANAWT